MIEKLAQLYKQGKLDGPLVRRVLSNIASNQLRKIAAGAPPAATLPSSMETLDAAKKLISRAMSADEVMNIASKIDDAHTYMSSSSTLADANILLERAASNAGHLFHPNAKGEVMEAVVKRLDDLGSAPKGIGEIVSRWAHKAGSHGQLAIAGTLGLLGMAAGNYAYDKYKDSQADKVLTDVLIENPDLDFKKARDNFDALKTVSPNIARNKAIATGYLSRMNEFDTLDLAPLQAAADIHKSRFTGDEKANWDFQKEISKGIGGSAGLM